MMGLECTAITELKRMKSCLAWSAQLLLNSNVHACRAQLRDATLQLFQGIPIFSTCHVYKKKATIDLSIILQMIIEIA